MVKATGQLLDRDNAAAAANPDTDTAQSAQQKEPVAVEKIDLHVASSEAGKSEEAQSREIAVVIGDLGQATVGGRADPVVSHGSSSATSAQEASETGEFVPGMDTSPDSEKRLAGSNDVGSAAIGRLEEAFFTVSLSNAGETDPEQIPIRTSESSVDSQSKEREMSVSLSNVAYSQIESFAGPNSEMQLIPMEHVPEELRMKEAEAVAIGRMNEEDTVEHILIQCVMAREVWYKCREELQLQFEIPDSDSNLQDWWLSERGRFREKERAWFDRLVCTVGHALWKNRSALCFNNTPLQRSADQLASAVREEFSNLRRVHRTDRVFDNG
ncbi:hypothetical protein ACQ4PT_072040 [Festuca glaucescens]